MRPFQMGLRVSFACNSSLESTRDRVVSRPIARQISAGYQRSQDHIGFVNREAAEPRNLRGRQAQSGKVAVFSREPRDGGEATIKIETGHGSTVRAARYIGK